MYAVIQTGGRQYRIEEGQRLKVEKLVAEAGDKVEFEQLLMVSQEGETKIGAPFVEGAKVVATVLQQGRLKKINIVKMRRRKNSRRQMGHRQYFTEIEIESIQV